MAVQGRPGTLLFSKRRFPRLFNQETVKASVSHNIPSSPIEGVTVFSDLETQYVYEHTMAGFYPQQGYPYCHTLIIPEQYDESEEAQLIQKCIVYLFGSLAAQAVEKHGQDIIGKELPEPECAQGIVTDGSRFSFVWYQLNTLDLSTVMRGVKNLASVSRLGQLYSVQKGTLSGRISHMDDHILQTLLAMLLWS